MLLKDCRVGTPIKTKEKFNIKGFGGDIINSFIYRHIIGFSFNSLMEEKELLNV